jgi:hypothetical protein
MFVFVLFMATLCAMLGGIGFAVQDERNCRSLRALYRVTLNAIRTFAFIRSFERRRFNLA